MILVFLCVFFAMCVCCVLFRVSLSCVFAFRLCFSFFGSCPRLIIRSFAHCFVVSPISWAYSLYLSPQNKIMFFSLPLDLLSVFRTDTHFFFFFFLLIRLFSCVFTVPPRVGVRKYVVWCLICGGLSCLLGVMFLGVYYLVRSYTSTVGYFETVPTFVPATLVSFHFHFNFSFFVPRFSL